MASLPTPPRARLRAHSAVLFGLLAGVLVVLAGCSSTSFPEEEVLLLEVAAETATCQGEAVQQCLRVRSPGEAEWRLFYDTIEGFTHEEGVRYVIEVARRVVPSPPADGSGFAYRLLRVVEEEPAGG